MKKIILTVLMASTVLFACSAKGASDQPKDEKASKADTSYAFGMVLGKSLGETGVELDYNAFLKGFKDSMEKKELKMSEEDATMKIQTAMMAAMAKISEANKAKEEAYLSENGKKAGVVTTASGLQYEVLTPASGAKPGAESVVRVHYVGNLTDGTTFDSSVARGEPAVFPLNQVIPGWTEGIQLMNVGSKYKLYIPSALAYGESGAGDVIPPFSTLIFEVELLGIEQ